MYNRYVVVGMVQTNCYIVAADNSDTCVIIDPGAHPGRIINAVDESGKKPVAILLTHGHFDHITAIPELLEKYGNKIKVYSSEAERELLGSADINCSSMVDRPVTVTADVYVNDGDIIEEAGLRFKVIATPGHTIGSVCYYIEDESVLFSGDTLFEMSVGRTDLPTGSSTAIVESIKNRLFVLPDSVTVYPGHGSETDIAFEKHNNMFI